MSTHPKQANENMALMDGTTDPIKRLFEAGEIVIGVWQDQRERYGVGFHVLKGARLLQECIASGENLHTRIAVIPCDDLEQAIAAKKIFGTRGHDA